MAARAFLTARPNSFTFEDRLLVLDSPAKVGRSHKEDRSESGNCFFDCKVLSRAHAKLLYDEGKFYLVDTGSSNGSFVNNIRLSKCGEESKVTQVYTGDLIRFGSDVVDKAKNVTQKCIVAQLKLFYPEGEEAEGRPSTSRLFRPAEGQEVSGGGLQEALAREKALEEQLARLREASGSRLQDGGELERVQLEKAQLHRRLGDIEQMLEDRERFCTGVINKQKEDTEEIAKLRQLIDNQNVDIANLENALGDVQGELDNKLKGAGDQDEMAAAYEAKFKALENSFEEERTKIRQQLHDVSANEINLLNKIKSLESEQGECQMPIE